MQKILILYLYKSTPFSSGETFFLSIRNLNRPRK